MSVRHSPTSRSGSLNDLPAQVEDTMEQQVTIRKRKHPERCCNCAQELQNFRKDITNLLDKFTKTQENTLTFMRENISEMKTQWNEIKTSIDTLSSEQASMKTQISNMLIKNNETEMKVEKLESGFTEIIKCVPKSNLISHESIMREFQERTTREKNIIIVGLPENRASTAEESRSADMASISKVIKTLVEDCPSPIRVYRLGKYDPSTNRKIKVCFETSQIAKALLRNKSKLTSNVKIISDVTPTQQNYLKELNEELNRRTRSGEENLTIKYVRGVPSIVQTKLSKN